MLSTEAQQRNTREPPPSPTSNYISDVYNCNCPDIRAYLKSILSALRSNATSMCTHRASIMNKQ